MEAGYGELGPCLWRRCSRRCSVAVWRQNTAGCWLRAARWITRGKLPCDRLPGRRASDLAQQLRAEGGGP